MSEHVNCLSIRFIRKWEKRRIKWRRTHLTELECGKMEDGASNK